MWIIWRCMSVAIEKWLRRLPAFFSARGCVLSIENAIMTENRVMVSNCHTYFFTFPDWDSRSLFIPVLHVPGDDSREKLVEW